MGVGSETMLCFSLGPLARQGLAMMPEVEGLMHVRVEMLYT
jgi:hypothetical protein